MPSFFVSIIDNTQKESYRTLIVTFYLPINISYYMRIRRVEAMI